MASVEICAVNGDQCRALLRYMDGIDVGLRDGIDILVHRSRMAVLNPILGQLQMLHNCVVSTRGDAQDCVVSNISSERRWAFAKFTLDSLTSQCTS